MSLWDLQHHLPPAQQLSTGNLTRLALLHFSLAKSLSMIAAELLEANGTTMQELLSGTAVDATGSLMDESTWQLLLN
jgi:hypothetical protein